MGEFPAEVLHRQPFAKILCRQQVPALADWQWLLAKLAGLPVSVIERAKSVLEKLEKYELVVFADEKKDGLAKAAAGRVASQVSLFAVTNETAIDELRGVNVEDLSADESKELLTKIKGKII